MKYEKCPICEEKLRNGVCPMCGYDFNRLGRSRILKDGHWDILTTDKKTSQPKYIHDEKRHPDFKNIKNTKTQSMKTQRKTSTYKNKKEKKRSKKGKWAVIVFILYLLSFLADLVPEAFTHIEDFINQILNGLNFLKKVSKSLSFLRKNGRLLFIFIF